MAKSAGHAHAIGLYEVGILVVIHVGIVFLRVPAVLCGLVKIRVREQPKADNACWIAEIGPKWQLGNIGESRAAGADRHARISLLVLERVWRTVLAACIKPEAKALRIGGRGFVKARLIDRAQPIPTRVAIAMFAIAIGLTGMRRDDFQKVKCCEAVSRDSVPKPVIAAGPEQPHVASLHLFSGHGRTIVHVVEVILLGLRKTPDI